MRAVVLLALAVSSAACAGADEVSTEAQPPPIEVVTCAPVPKGFVAWRSGELVRVSKKLTGSAGGVALQAVIHNVPAEELPAQVDFGAELIEVQADMTLCLLSRPDGGA